MDSVDKMKDGCTSPPPPYAQHQNIAGVTETEDFPQFGNSTKEQPPPPTLNYAVQGVKVQSQVNTIVTSPSQATLSKSPPPIPQASELPGNPSDQGQGQGYQSDIFHKPPKFLLYSSVGGPGQEVTGEFKEGFQPPGQNQNQPMDQMTTGVGHQNQLKVPAAFNVANNAQILQGQAALTQAQGPFAIDSYMPRNRHRVICPYCRVPVITETDYVNGTLTHLAAFACCWFSCCCCIPYFINDLKDVEHYCPHCNNVIGYNHKKVC